jgi:hypothetical protein
MFAAPVPPMPANLLVGRPGTKGKLLGAKPPLRPLAIDSKQRGCDVVAVRVEYVPKLRPKDRYARFRSGAACSSSTAAAHR